MPMKDLRPSEWVITTLVMLAGVLLLATAGGWALGFQQLWAFRFLLHLAWPLRLLLTLALAIISVFAWRKGVGVQQNARQTVLGRLDYAPPLILVAAAVLFWAFRERTYHGDALLKLELLSTHTLQTDPYIWKEPLDSLLAYTLTTLLRSVGRPPENAVALLSVLAGVVYVAAVLYIAKLLSQTQRDVYIYSIGLLALGSSQLWFGHVENYSWVTACSFAAVALAVGYLRGREAQWSLLFGVGLAAGFAVSFHPQAAFVLPALLVLLNRSQWSGQVGVLALSGLIGPLVTVLGMMAMAAPWPDLANGFAGDPQLFLTPAQALSPQQLADAFNNLWLVAPLAPLWLAGAALMVRNRWAWRDPIFRCLAVVAAGLLFYHFSFQNDLPRPRDWDLFAIVGPGLTLFGLYGWLGPHAKPGPGAWLWPSLVFAALFTASWVGVNYALILIRPDPDQRDIYARYRLIDLTTLVAQATVTPSTPICTEPAAATDCARVAVSSFTMPQDGDTRPIIFAHAPARVILPLHTPNERSFLWLSPALDPAAWDWGGDGVTFKVAVMYAGEESLLWARHLSPAQVSDRDWQSVMIPLDRYRGRQVDLILETDPGPARNDAGDRAGWGLPWLMQGVPDGIVN